MSFHEQGNKGPENVRVRSLKNNTLEVEFRLLAPKARSFLHVILFPNPVDSGLFTEGNLTLNSVNSVATRVSLQGTPLQKLHGQSASLRKSIWRPLPSEVLPVFFLTCSHSHSHSLSLPTHTTVTLWQETTSAPCD